MNQSATVSYAERWSGKKGGVVRPLEEEEARRRHDRGELYVAVLGNSQRPRAYLEVRFEAGFAGVHFLDGELRNHLTYCSPVHRAVREACSWKRSADVPTTIQVSLRTMSTTSLKSPTRCT